MENGRHTHRITIRGNMLRRYQGTINTIWCWNCDKEIDFYDNDTYETNDIIDGEYYEYEAIRCPRCDVENRWPND